MDYKKVTDSLQNTRDISLYLDCLKRIKERSIIILSTRQTPGDIMPEPVFEKIHELGFTNLTKTKLQMYVGVISRGIPICDQSAKFPNVPVEFNSCVEGVDLSVISRSWNGGLLSSIILNGAEYSMNMMCWNIVVYDLIENRVLDSCNYCAAYTEVATFFHRNLSFDDKYFDKHFYIPENRKNEWYLPYKKKYFSDRPLKAVEIVNGIILPNKVINNAAYGGVCTENFEFVSGHSTFMADTNSLSRHIAGSYNVSENELDFVDETVVYGGTLMDHPGHLMCEGFMDRLWWYVKNPDSWNIKVAVVCIWGNGTFRFQKEFLMQFGFKEENIIFVNIPTKFKKVIVPDQSAYPYKSIAPLPYEYTAEAYSVFTQLKVDIPKSDCKKVYFTKRKTDKNNIFGEDYFIDFYEKKGFRVIDPEDYCLKEKIALLANAEEFVTQIGTNSIYAVFCQPNVKLTLLSRANNFTNDIQALMYEMAGIKECYCVDISYNFLHSHIVYGYSLVGPTDYFKKYVKNFYGEDIKITSEDFLKSHMVDYMIKISDYYTDPRFFDSIKNQKMLTVLQNISEVFAHKEFDTSKLDLTTNEDVLRDQIKLLTSNLDASRKRVEELENTNINKLLKIVEVSNKIFENQFADLQSKIDELSKEKQLQNDLKSAEKANKELMAKIEKAQNESAYLQKQVNDYEHSRSWRITKPLRSIAWFFGRLFGKAK